MLVFAGDAIDVHPPRATAFNKSLVGLWRLRVLGRRVRSLFGTEFVVRPSRYFENAHFELPTVLRCIVPGWANLYLGRPISGALFLVGYLFLLFFGLLMIGTQGGAILLGCAFAIHTASISTALVPSFESYRDRLLFTALNGLILALGVYWPVGFLLGRIATPLSINQSLPPVAEGDVIWFHPTSQVTCGDFAVYNSTFRTYGLHGNYVHGGRFILEAGMRISRVIAGAGQTISWNGTTMLVDGTPATAPLPSAYAAIWPSLKVPDDSVLIDPTNLVPGGVPNATGQIVTTGQVHGAPVAAELTVNSDLLQSIAIVPAPNVLGRVIWRSWPISRAGFLRD